jgi:integrase
MYCCGVRAAEARQLKCQDVHLDKSFVDILWAKAHRDRRLFLSEELTQYLIDYDAAIRKIFPEREYFFPGGHGGICSSTALVVNFRNIWLSAGLKRDGKIKPRAYDFRHHFACANIMRWMSEGKDIHAMLPYLMRYMGHSSLESTYYYIHLIPDFFPQYCSMTASTEELIPEVDADEV